jgi:putative ABC transport system ATP-binding protein
MAIVECEAITKIYRQGSDTVTALDKVDLTVAPGEFLALAGPSGSGKTTLLNIIGGLDRTDEGRVTVEGQLFSEASPSQLADLRLKKIGFVFQSYNLIPVLSALENVEYIMLLQGVAASERRRRAGDILAEVGLEGKLHNRPSQLSGGQQQRVAVARAIVSQPAIVLADEPTANLDSKTGNSLLGLMKGLNEKHGTTFIFSTHDQMVMSYAERLLYLYDGRMESGGKP